jgi:hypothetical protein
MGYAPVGKQLKIQRSASRRTTISSLVAASMEQIISRVELQGSFRSQTFSSFLESLPLPSGTVVLLNNVAFHHSKVAKDAAERKGKVSSYCLFHLTLLGLIPSRECFQPSRGSFTSMETFLGHLMLLKQPIVNHSLRNHLKPFKEDEKCDCKTISNSIHHFELWKKMSTKGNGLTGLQNAKHRRNFLRQL